MRRNETRPEDTRDRSSASLHGCHDFEPLLVERLDGSLDAASSAVLDGHLDACTACRAEAESLARIWDGLGELADEAPSEALRPRFYAMLDAYRDGRRQSLEESRRSLAGRLEQWLAAWWPRRPAWQAGWAAAALVLGLLGGLGLRGAGPANGTEIQSLRAEVDSLNRLVGLSLLSQTSAADRLRGVAYSQRHADDEILVALLRVLDTDANASVRLAAVDALSRYADRRPVVDGLRTSLSRQRSPLVQLALVDLLLDIDGAESEAAVLELLDDPDLDATVREHVESLTDPLAASSKGPRT